MTVKFQRLLATKNTNDEWWSSFVTSPIAIAVNYFVVEWKWLTPNLLTLFSFIVALVSAALIIIGGQIEFYAAAVLIHLSHVLDCMDGQMARYRGVSSRTGEFWDKMTDQIQVMLWFGAIGYAAYSQTGEVTPIFLAFAGVACYAHRGYVKYTVIYIEMNHDDGYLKRVVDEVSEIGEKRKGVAGVGHGLIDNLRWFAREQRKILSFDEGVFIFMLSIALVFNILSSMLWVFAVSQVFYAVIRTCQRGSGLNSSQSQQILTTTEK